MTLTDVHNLFNRNRHAGWVKNQPEALRRGVS